MRSKILLTILLCAAVLIPVVSALDPTDAVSETKLTILECTGSVSKGDHVVIKAQLTYANGTQMNIEYMDNLFIDTYVNGHKTNGLSQCDGSGNIKVYLGYWPTRNPSPYELKEGSNNIHFEFKGRDYYGLMPSKSQTYVVNAHGTDPGGSGSYMLDLISYAKGFFALSFFGALFGTIGLGCISVITDDPEKKAASQTRLFFIGKVLLTVTLLFMAVLFVAP